MKYALILPLDQLKLRPKFSQPGQLASGNDASSRMVEQHPRLHRHQRLIAGVGDPRVRRARIAAQGDGLPYLIQRFYRMRALRGDAADARVRTLLPRILGVVELSQSGLSVGLVSSTSDFRR